MTCERWQELILDREYLDDTQQRELDHHLLSCLDCRVWAKALAETETTMTEQLRAETHPSSLRALILRAVARERRQNWMAAVPDLLDIVGWVAIGIVTVAGLLFWANWTSWFGNPLVWAGVVAIAGSVGWVGGVLWKKESETGFVL